MTETELEELERLRASEKLWNIWHDEKEQELERLRKQEIIWKKIYKYEKEKWIAYMQAMPGLASQKEIDHVKNLMELSKD